MSQSNTSVLAAGQQGCRDVKREQRINTKQKKYPFITYLPKVSPSIELKSFDDILFQRA